MATKDTRWAVATTDDGIFPPRATRREAGFCVRYTRTKIGDLYKYTDPSR